MLKKKTRLSLLLAMLCCALLCGCASSVRLGDKKYPVDSTELQVILEAEEFSKLEQFQQLRSLNLSGSTCYEKIAAWSKAHPNVDITYTVMFPNGTAAENSAETLDLSGLDRNMAAEAARLMEYLPELERVDLGSASGELGCEEVSVFVSAFPEISFDYSFNLLGKTLSLSEKSLDLSKISHSDAEQLLNWMPCMKQLKKVDLGNDWEGTRDLSWDDVSALQNACPDAEFEYGFTLYGKQFKLSDTKMDLNHITMDDEGALVLQVARCMPNLRYLDMDFCGVSDEAMANIRDSLPDTEVVWRIWFGKKYSVRTDVKTILASNPGAGGDLTKENTESLKYCTKVKYLDLGHNITLDSIDFVSYMPDLEVAILAMACWDDARPLANCPKLEYLEVQTTALCDLSPLSSLKNLRHLNICYCFGIHDISPLYELTQLERLWIGFLDPVPQEQIDKMQELAPNCEIDTSVLDPTSGRWRYLGKDELGFTIVDPRYKLLREQFGYDEQPYAYYWNDPLYGPHD